MKNKVMSFDRTKPCLIASLMSSAASTVKNKKFINQGKQIYVYKIFFIAVFRSAQVEQFARKRPV